MTFVSEINGGRTGFCYIKQNHGIRGKIWKSKNKLFRKLPKLLFDYRGVKFRLQRQVFRCRLNRRW